MTIVTINLPPRVPMVTHQIWDARHRMLCAKTADLKMHWGSRYVQLRKQRGDFANQRPEGSAPG